MLNKRINKSNKSFIFVIAIMFFCFITIGYSLLSQTLFVSTGGKFDGVAMLLSTSNKDSTAFRNSTYKTNIKNIIFEDKINVPAEAIDSWDIGVSQTDDVIAFVVYNSADSKYYDLYIQSNLKLYANPDMSYWFSGFTALDSIKGLEFVDTIFTTNMSNMFYRAGYNSSDFVLDVSSLNTSNVTNMVNMFDSAGYSSKVFTLNLTGLDTSSVTTMNGMFRNSGFSNPSFTLDVSGFDTGNVTDFSYMFHQAGYVSTVFELDVSGFDTSKAITFTNMFRIAGYRSTVFTLDVSGFDTSNATIMNGMFHNAGYSSPIFTLDVSNFDTSKVTSMSEMFYYTGYLNPDFTLDVSGFDTSKVTNMNNMFNNTGFKSKVLEIDVSNFDTSKVIDMSYMFNNTGYNNVNFTLDVSNFDTSKVTNMFSMFAGTGYLSTVIEFNLSNFDTSQVTNMGSMFLSAGYNNPNFTLDVSNFNTSKVTNMQNMFRASGTNSNNYSLDISNFDTSNVTNLSAMFYYVAYYSTDFTLTLGEFDTSSATNMISLFHCAGKSSSKLDVEITIKNPNITSYSNMFNGVATVSGSKIVVKYTSETSDLVDLMIATKSINSNVFKDVVYADTSSLKVGDLLTIAGDNFNVIDINGDYVSLLAQYNIGSSYRQSTSAYNVTFADMKNWSIVDDNKEIDIQSYSTNPKRLVNGYVDYLKNVTGINDISGDLISLSQLGGLDCVINESYITASDLTCANSQYASWLVNGQYWWTKSMFPSNLSRVWLVYNDGMLNPIGYTDSRGIRPVITVPKFLFSSETITFTIAGVKYNAKKGMNWQQWIDSSYNNGDTIFEVVDEYVASFPGPMVVEMNNAVGLTDLIVAGGSYTTRLYI